MYFLGPVSPRSGFGIRLRLMRIQLPISQSIFFIQLPFSSSDRRVLHFGAYRDTHHRLFPILKARVLVPIQQAVRL